MKADRINRQNVGKTRGFMAQNRIVAVLTKTGAFFNNVVIRVAVRFFSGVPHPHLLGVCCPNISDFGLTPAREFPRFCSPARGRSSIG